jgi:hypothetical protein
VTGHKDLERDETIGGWRISLYWWENPVMTSDRGCWVVTVRLHWGMPSADRLLPGLGLRSSNETFTNKREALRAYRARLREMKVELALVALSI